MRHLKLVPEARKAALENQPPLHNPAIANTGNRHSAVGNTCCEATKLRSCGAKAETNHHPLPPLHARYCNCTTRYRRRFCLRVSPVFGELLLEVAVPPGSVKRAKRPRDPRPVLLRRSAIPTRGFAIASPPCPPRVSMGSDGSGGRRPLHRAPPDT